MNTANYFLPSMRRGLATAIAQPASNVQRAQIDVEVHVQARRAGQSFFDKEPVSKSFQIYGPRDVLGFHPRIVTRTYPEPNIDNFESNFFPAIEFAQADFVWRYTPETVRSNGSLQPWVALVVLVAQDRDKHVTKQFQEGEWMPSCPAPWIQVLDQRSLPDLVNAWLWAHVHVADETGSLDAKALTKLFENEPDRAICRLLCPRRLHPETQYSAFVLPTFELGRLAALGKPADASITANTPAWSSQSNEPKKLPYYFRWEFRTGEGGDFEELVRQLQPRVLTGVGTRTVDASTPGFDIAGEEMEMEGALKPLSLPAARLASPATKNAISDLLQQNIATSTHDYSVEVDPPTSSDVNELEVDVLRDGHSVRIGFTTENDCTSRVDYGESATYGQSVEHAGYRTDHSVTITGLEPHMRYHFMVEVTARDGTVCNTADGWFTMPKRLWVTPPIYGRWHKGDARLNSGAPGSWLDSLNLEPIHRAAAGLGSTVVRQNQEDLMSAAWEQLGRVNEANEILRQAQFGVEVAKSYYRRISRMDLDTVLHVAGPAQPRVLADPNATEPATLPAHINKKSFLPRAAMQPALRRLTKPRGAIRRRQGVHNRRPVSTAAATGVLERLASKGLEAAGPHPTPGGTPSFGKVTKLFHSTSTYIDDVVGEGPEFFLFDEHSIAENWLDSESVKNFRGGGDYSTPEVDNLVNKREDIADISRIVMDKWLNMASVDPDNPDNSRSPQNRNFLKQIRNTVLHALRPEQTVARRTQLRLGLTQAELRALSSKSSGADTLDEIMAAPEFPQPMYEPLQEMSQDLLLPGVSKIPPNTLALLETNRQFVESYLVGCNHEFAAELLWRRYPTDQRGSFFCQFWDVGEYIPKPDEVTSDGELLESVQNRLRDISQIHTWGSQALGANYVEQPNDGHGLFLLIRGDLLRRYPSAVIYAVESVPKRPTSSNFVPGLPEYVTGYGDSISHQGRIITPIYPDFKGTLQPDITFLRFRLPEGMDIRAATDTGSGGEHGIYFVFEERVSELRFGMDVSAPKQFQTWNDLSWEHFYFGPEGAEGQDVDSGDFLDFTPKDDAGKTWDEGNNSATLAYLTLQRPVRVVRHASQMIHSNYFP
ncbi:MAG: fibronectin type III domain-containing protein [Candidatus Omnitrophica bacterium]|nr:fibronectin type III domain-containing protein [Candidatus Omnitrophota bacterium]